MHRETNYFKIGLFTLAALAVMAAGIMYFGLSSAFTPTLSCDTYFSYSVQGLSTGSSVNFRGFKVGQVESLSLARDGSKDGGRQAVRIKFILFPKDICGSDCLEEEEAKAFLLDEIKRGLRVQLSFQGISGVSYLSLDYLTEAQLAAEGHIPLPGLEGTTMTIPNSQSMFIELGESVSRIVRSFRDVDFYALSTKTQAVLVNMEKATERLNSDLEAIAGKIPATIEEIGETASQVSSLAQEIKGDLALLRQSSSLSLLAASIGRFHSAVSRADQILRGPQNSLPATFDNLRVMSENFRELSEMAKRYPSQILFGEAPREIKP
jgi:phospholipid/cholesterol/gamma-HCH transport system substrate-binding protein/paraquat-inducible protein B